jgi:hypothetical protein
VKRRLVYLAIEAHLVLGFFNNKPFPFANTTIIKLSKEQVYNKGSLIARNIEKK